MAELLFGDGLELPGGRSAPGGFGALFFWRHDPTVPEGYRNRAKGMLINMEMADADKEHDRLVEEKIPLVTGIRREEFGQRHLIIQDPSGILIEIIQNRPPSDEFSKQRT